MSSPCATCTRRCCHHYIVTVTGYDVWVIARGLRLAPEQFLIAVPQWTPTGRGFRLDRGERTFEIALDKARARTKERPCVFWYGLPGGGGRCGIYPFRPQVCQTYPAVLHQGAALRREDVLCPADAWRDGALQGPPWRGRLTHMRVETDIYGLMVARWNQHVLATAHPERLSLAGYYAYLLAFYERLAPVRAMLDAAEWAALCDQWSWAVERGSSPLVEAAPALEPWAEVLAAIRAVAGEFFLDDLLVAAD